MKRVFQFAVLLLIVTAFSIPPKKVTLEYKFAKGDKFRLMTSADQKIMQEIPGMGPMDITSKMDGAMIFEVTSVASGIADCKVNYEFLAVETSNPMSGTMKMDSREDESNQMNAMMKGFTEGTFTLKMHGNGKITDIEGVDKVYENAMSKLTGVAPQMQAALEQQMGAQFGGEALQGNIEGALVFYTSEKVSKGSTWESTLTIAGGMYGETTNTWTLNSISDDTAEIGVSGNFKSDFDRPMEVSGISGAKFKITGDQSGTFTIDPGNGWVKDSQVTVNMHGTIEIPAGGQVPTDMSIPMEINSVNKYMMEKL